MFRSVLFMAMAFLVVLPVSAQQKQDKETRNRETFMRIAEEAFNQGRVEEVLSEVLAPDFVNHSPNGDSNREGAIATISAYRQAMPDLTLMPEMVIADGDYVAGRFVFEGTFENPFSMPMGDAIPPTGQSVRFIIATTYRFNVDGKAVEEWLLWDNLSLLTQLGVLPGGGAGAALEATDPVSVIARFYDYHNAGRYDAQASLWADDPTLTLPDGQVLRGHEAVTSFRPPHGRIEIGDIEVAGNTIRWTSMLESGDRYLLEAVVEGGRIQSLRFR